MDLTQIALLISLFILIPIIIVLIIGAMKYQKDTASLKMHVESHKLQQQKYEDMIEVANRAQTENESLFEMINRERKLYESETERLRLQHSADIKSARADSLAKSRATMRGQATEHLVPHLSSKWSAKDYRFVGNPIDFIVCAGASAVNDKLSDTVDEVILLEVKTGKAQLTKVQRRIRDAVKAGRVKFVQYNADTKESKEWSMPCQS